MDFRQFKDKLWPIHYSIQFPGNQEKCPKILLFPRRSYNLCFKGIVFYLVASVSAQYMNKSNKKGANQYLAESLFTF